MEALSLMETGLTMVEVPRTSRLVLIASVCTAWGEAG